MIIQPYIHKKVPALALEHPYEDLALRVLAGVLVVLSLLYIYFVTASIFNVIARKEALTHSATLETSVGILQKQYFELAQSITPESFSAIGFTAITAPHFAFRLGTIGESNAPRRTTANTTI